MEFNDNLPIYLQIINYLKRKITSGEISGGDKLPSVRELSSKLKVNPNTVQRAYQELERENLVFTKRGMGTFATEDGYVIMKLKKDIAKEVISNFIAEIKGLDFDDDEIIEIILNEIKKED